MQQRSRRRVTEYWKARGDVAGCREAVYTRSGGGPSRPCADQWLPRQTAQQCARGALPRTAPSRHPDRIPEACRDGNSRGLNSCGLQCSRFDMAADGDPDPTSAGTAGEAARWGGSSAGVGMAANPFAALCVTKIRLGMDAKKRLVKLAT